MKRLREKKITKQNKIDHRKKAIKSNIMDKQAQSQDLHDFVNASEEK